MDRFAAGLVIVAAIMDDFPSVERAFGALKMAWDSMSCGDTRDLRRHRNQRRVFVIM